MADSPMIKRTSTDPERAPLKQAPEIREKAPEPVAPTPASFKLATAPAQVTPIAPPRQKRSIKRFILFAVIPIACVVGGYMYVTGGQIMSTDNAYIQADQIGVSTDVPGTVIDINVHENELVKKGQLLYRLKPDTYQVALDGAKAQLAAVHDQVLTLQASYKLALAQIDQAQADLSFYQTSYNRQQDLSNTGAGTKAAFDAASHDLEATRQKIQVSKIQAEVTLAQLGGNPNQPIEQNPLYLQAKSGVDNAQSDLNDTVVRAAFDGVVTNVNAIRVGSYLQASQTAFNLVSSTRIWVAASPKETELTYVKTGQPATLSVDAYPGVEWKGVVESISPASGSSFSLLPAQNTTGNWVKVVQRIPMRVAIEDTEGKPPLRVGMSVSVDVDTGHARGLPKFIADFLASFDRKAKPRG